MKGIVFANSRDSLNIRYIFEDSRGEASTAVNAYNKLITLDKVDYVLGDMLSQTTESMAPLALQNQKLLVSPTASSKSISKDNIYALSVFPCETYESKIVAGFAKGRYEKVGVLYEKVAAAQAMRDAFAEVFNENELVLDEAFESSITSFRDIIFKCQQRGIKIVVYSPPMYRKYREKTGTVKELERFCKDNAIPYYYDTQDSLFLEHPEWFYDNTHLTKYGALEYSRLFASRLKHM